MEIHSQWTFDCRPEHVWPHFLHARMDDTRPLLFRLGVPKPVSCRVLEGVPAVGNTRQCTTDRGTIDQRILVLDEPRRLRYRMVASTVWCRDWVGLLEDEFTLTPIEGGRTRVERRTVFSARGLFAGSADRVMARVAAGAPVCGPQLAAPRDGGAGAGGRDGAGALGPGSRRSTSRQPPRDRAPEPGFQPGHSSRSASSFRSLTSKSHASSAFRSVVWPGRARSVAARTRSTAPAGARPRDRRCARRQLGRLDAENIDRIAIDLRRRLVRADHLRTENRIHGSPARFATSTISRMLPFDSGAMMKRRFSRCSAATASGHGSRLCHARLSASMSASGTSSIP